MFLVKIQYEPFFLIVDLAVIISILAGPKYNFRKNNANSKHIHLRIILKRLPKKDEHFQPTN